jgi:hypothetical protein
VRSRVRTRTHGSVGRRGCGPSDPIGRRHTAGGRVRSGLMAARRSLGACATRRLAGRGVGGETAVCGSQARWHGLSVRADRPEPGIETARRPRAGAGLRVRRRFAGGRRRAACSGQEARCKARDGVGSSRWRSRAGVERRAGPTQRESRNTVRGRCGIARRAACSCREQLARGVNGYC